MQSEQIRNLSTQLNLRWIYLSKESHPTQLPSYKYKLLNATIVIHAFIVELQVLVMKSLRKPKRLIIRGDDEREYKFLVKGGEDLRQDQRIEMVFTNMNQMMAKSRKCQRLSLVTYNVIPINTRWASLLA
mgnify:FL=1